MNDPVPSSRRPSDECRPSCGRLGLVTVGCRTVVVGRDATSDPTPFALQPGTVGRGRRRALVRGLLVEVTDVFDLLGGDTV